MFLTRRLLLPLMMVVVSSTALASAYEIDPPDSTVQATTPGYPLLFSAFIADLASHLGLGNGRKPLRSLGLVFDLASLESPTELAVTYDLRLSPAGGTTMGRLSIEAGNSR